MSDLTLFSDKVFLSRGQRVMFDRDVALALGVETKELNQNASRSPKWGFLREEGVEEEYRFQLTLDELSLVLRWSRNVVTSATRREDRLPWVYTKKGCAYFGTSLYSDEACRLAVELAEVFVSQKQRYRMIDLYPNEKYGQAVDLIKHTREVYLLLGNSVAIANSNAVVTAKREYPSVDFGDALLGSNKTEKKQQLLTPTELAKCLSQKVGSQKITAIGVNVALIDLGLQDFTQDPGKTRKYFLTEKGKNYGEMLSVNKKRSDGTPVMQIKWYCDDTISLLFDHFNN